MFSAKAITNMIQNAINSSQNGCPSSRDNSFLNILNAKNEQVALSINFNVNTITVCHDDKVLKTITITAQKEKDDAYHTARTVIQEIKSLKV